MNDLDGPVWQRPGSDICRGTPSGGIAVRHEDHALETFEEQTLLWFVKRRSPQLSATTEPTPAWCNWKQSRKPSTTTTAGFSAAAR